MITWNQFCSVAVATSFLVAGAIAVHADPPLQEDQTFEVKRAVLMQEMNPSDFLDAVGQQTKALWRQHYRDRPPLPSMERLRVSFTLGGLIADGYLALQAGDPQQFKNNNQDILNYCRVLALAEKVSPGVLAQSKMAETKDWEAVRKQVAETQTFIEQQLRDQRDEDLAILVNLGMWMRLLEITSTLVVNDEEIQNKTLTIGSLPLIQELVLRFNKLGEASKKEDGVSNIGALLEYLADRWGNKPGPPSNELVHRTNEKLIALMAKITLK